VVVLLEFALAETELVVCEILLFYFVPFWMDPPRLISCYTYMTNLKDPEKCNWSINVACNVQDFIGGVRSCL